MASRKRNKSIKVKNNIDLKKLTLCDVICPVCRSILIEPVTLPCSHIFCSVCFKGSIENNSLTCPICRTRIGSWLRSATKLNNIINKQLWDYIKDTFHEEIEAKSRGDDIDTSTIDGPPLSLRLSLPGEIRKEYELELANQQQQSSIEKQKEITASETYIRKLHEEEIKLQLETEERIRKDTEIAKKIARGLSIDSNGTSTFHSASDQSSREASTIAGSSVVILENVDYIKHPLFGRSHIKINLSQHQKRAPNMFYKSLNEKPDVNERLDYCAQINNSKGKDSNIQIEDAIDGSNQDHASTSFGFVKSLAFKFSKGTEKIKRSVRNILNNQDNDNYMHPNDVVMPGSLSAIPPSIARSLLNELAQSPSRLRDSVDSIRSEVRYFRPVSSERRTPYKKLSNGKRVPQQPLRLATIRNVPNCSINLYTERARIQVKGPKSLKKQTSKRSAFASGKMGFTKVIANKNTSSVNIYNKSLKRTTRSMNIDLEDDSDIEVSTPQKIKKLSTNGNIHSEASTSKLSLYSNSNVKKPSIKNGILNDDVEKQQQELENILVQEKKDLELAKKLQEEWNNSQHNHNTRSNLPGNTKKKNIILPARNNNNKKRNASSRTSPRKKQMTLDGIFSPKRN